MSNSIASNFVSKYNTYMGAARSMGQLEIRGDTPEERLRDSVRVGRTINTIETRAIYESIPIRSGPAEDPTLSTRVSGVRGAASVSAQQFQGTQQLQTAQQTQTAQQALTYDRKSLAQSSALVGSLVNLRA